MEQNRIVLIQNTAVDPGIEFKEVSILLNQVSTGTSGDSLLVGGDNGAFKALQAHTTDDGKVIKVNSSGVFVLDDENEATDPTKIIDDAEGTETEVAIIDDGATPLSYVKVTIDGVEYSDTVEVEDLTISAKDVNIEISEAPKPSIKVTVRRTDK